MCIKKESYSSDPQAQAARRQTKSSLSVDVNCQHRLTSCHGGSDCQDALITGTTLRLQTEFYTQKI